MEKVAQQAGKAAPAVVVVGALAAGPQAHGFTAKPAAGAGAAAEAAPRPAGAAGRAVHAHLDAVARPAHAAARTYTVRAGDTLSGIAARYYRNAGDWRWLYHVNHSKISNPNLIYPGEVLRVPPDPPASWTAHSLRHHQQAPARRTHGDGDHDGDDGYQPRHSRPSHHHRADPGGHQGGGLHGTLGCGGLERLWESAGGSPAAAVTAASVAMAESSGNQFATGPYGERGYWQINPVNGALSTYNAYGNARSAVIMSHDGTNWSPWTTYVDGAYLGRC
jgi:hypothetical protein